MEQFLFEVVCSTIKILHDLSSNRREPGWFLSLSLFEIFSTKGPVFLYSILRLNWQISVFDLDS